MTEEVQEEIKKPFRLSEEELADPKLRKGYPGRAYYPRISMEEGFTELPKNYKPSLAGYYKAGRYVGMRGHYADALRALLPPRTKKVVT